jgi:hypothetical protein
MSLGGAPGKGDAHRMQANTMMASEHHDRQQQVGECVLLVLASDDNLWALPCDADLIAMP